MEPIQRVAIIKDVVEELCRNDCLNEEGRQAILETLRCYLVRSMREMERELVATA